MFELFEKKYKADIINLFKGKMPLFLRAMGDADYRTKTMKQTI